MKYQVNKVNLATALNSVPVLGGVAEETAEGDYGGEAREVDEDVRGDRLHGQRVFEVGQVAEIERGKSCNGPAAAVTFYLTQILSSHYYRQRD